MILTKVNLQPKYSKVTAITATIICSAFALWSLVWFWSSVLTVRPEVVITQWEHSSEKVNQELAIQMIARLKQSIAINPLNANSQLLLARYYEALTSAEPNQYSPLVEQAYKKAIKHQPSWDYAWTRLAIFYSNQKVVNEAKLITALSTAMSLGPYESKSHPLLIPLIFKHWQLITSNKQTKHQEQAIKIVKHALSYSHALLTLNSAKKYQQLTTLAPLLTKQWPKNFVKKHLKVATNDQ